MLLEEEIRLLKSFYKEEGISDLLEYFIDYSHIKDTKFREYLESINRKMIKARIRNDFGEYCRYAFMQIEAIAEEYTKETRQKYEDFKNKPENQKFYKDSILDIIAYSLTAKLPGNTFNYNSPDDYKLFSDISTLKKIRDFLSHGKLSNKLDVPCRAKLDGKRWDIIKVNVRDYFELFIKGEFGR